MLKLGNISLARRNSSRISTAVLLRLKRRPSWTKADANKLFGISKSRVRGHLVFVLLSYMLIDYGADEMEHSEPLQLMEYLYDLEHKVVEYKQKDGRPVIVILKNVDTLAQYHSSLLTHLQSMVWLSRLLL